LSYLAWDYRAGRGRPCRLPMEARDFFRLSPAP